MVEIQTVTIRLGEKEYTVREAPHLRAAPWRRQLMAEIKPMFERITNAQNIEFNTPADLLALWPLFQQIFTDGLETIYAMLICYSADLEADADYIANHATDKQILAAFQEVVKLADPFGFTQTLTRQIGLATIGTSSNSPSANGVVRSKKRQR
jgi:hypothetical protein